MTRVEQSAPRKVILNFSLWITVPSNVQPRTKFEIVIAVETSNFPWIIEFVNSKFEFALGSCNWHELAGQACGLSLLKNLLQSPIVFFSLFACLAKSYGTSGKSIAEAAFLLTLQIAPSKLTVSVLLSYFWLSEPTRQ